jgi:hypothetical protein
MDNAGDVSQAVFGASATVARRRGGRCDLHRQEDLWGDKRKGQHLVNWGSSLAGRGVNYVDPEVGVLQGEGGGLAKTVAVGGGEGTYTSALKEHTKRGNEDGEDDLADVGSLHTSRSISYVSRGTVETPGGRPSECLVRDTARDARTATGGDSR